MPRHVKIHLVELPPILFRAEQTQQPVQLRLADLIERQDVKVAEDPGLDAEARFVRVVVLARDCAASHLVATW
jgi:hypothetical protein